MTETALARVSRTWWIFLITGVMWLIISLIILRFNTTSLTTIAVLFGLLAIVAGVNELLIAVTVRSWRWLHIGLGALFVVVGVVALFNPGATFWALAAIIGWYLLFKGTLDLVESILTRRENELWWLGLIVGIIQIMLAFWAAGGFGRKTVLLIIWAAAAAMARGVTEIVIAFRVRALPRTVEGWSDQEAHDYQLPRVSPG